MLFAYDTAKLRHKSYAGAAKDISIAAPATYFLHK